MGKKSVAIWMMLVCTSSMVACSQQEVSEVPRNEVVVSEEVPSSLETQEEVIQQPTTTQEEPQAEATMESEVETEAALQQAIIYYGNGTATGLKMEEVSMSELTPMTLLGLLARHNIVSIDTKAQEFEVKEADGKKIIYLDLSKQFKDYMNMMGKDGEYIVIAGLTNTFLSTYQGDELHLTVNQSPLLSNHNHYDKPLTFYALEDEKKEEITYTLKEEVIQEENVDIRYPQFRDMKNEKVMSLWNESIKEAAITNYREAGITEYTLNYEIASQNAGIVSMVLRGNCNYAGAAYPYDFEATFNFDLTTGKNLRLADYRNLEELADYLKNGYGYRTLNEDISKEVIDEYLQNDFTDDYVKLLENYDYDLSNSNLIPTGYSYIKDDQTLVLVIEVNHAMGDYLEILIE